MDQPTPRPDSALSPDLRVSSAERQHVLDHLQAACVEGRLSLEEFSDRIELALSAQTRSHLAALTRDLPAPTGFAPAAARLERVAIPTSSVTAVLSSVERSGAWRLGETCTVNVVCASCKLDLRRATVSSAITVLDVRVFAADLLITVPSGVEVSVEVDSVAASKTVHLTDQAVPPNAPCLVVRGVVVAGAIKVLDA